MEIVYRMIEDIRVGGIWRWVEYGERGLPGGIWEGIGLGQG